MWRCHIDLSNADPAVWDFVAPRVATYDAAVFSHVTFVPPLPVPAYLAPPSIDPLSDKNRELDADEIEACTPVYETFPGWTETTFGTTSWDKLPANARAYLKRVEEVIGAPIDMVSTGPDREHTIVLRHPYSA